LNLGVRVFFIGLTVFFFGLTAYFLGGDGANFLGVLVSILPFYRVVLLNFLTNASLNTSLFSIGFSIFFFVWLSLLNTSKVVACDDGGPSELNSIVSISVLDEYTWIYCLSTGLSRLSLVSLKLYSSILVRG